MLRINHGLANPSAVGRVVASAILTYAAVSVSSVSADSYEVDPAHSSVVFGVKHSEMNIIYGIFSESSGTFTVDEQGGIDISIGVESINTGNEARDRHLKSADFFSARQFPEIKFVADQVEASGPDTLRADGELTLHGVTNPLAVELRTAMGTGRGGEQRASISASFLINRSDFQLGGSGGLSNAVRVIVSLQGVAQ